MARRTLLIHALVTAAGTLFALMLSGHAPLGKLLWPPDPSAPEPSDAQGAGFMAYGVYESIAFGLGVVLTSNLVFVLRRTPQAPRGSSLAVLCLAWLLLSWVPHDNLHQMVGMDLNGLLALEWGFHSTLIASTLYVARFVYLQLAGPAQLAGDKPAASPRIARA